MQLSELKLVTASNIINLRTAAGMTQAELGARINYSDKAISKWERGEAIPDAFVLTQLAELFHVTVDWLLSSHDDWQAPEPEDEDAPDPKYTAGIIIAICVLGVWTAALTGFVALWLAGIVWWKIFVVAIPVSLIVYIVLICIFKWKHHLQYGIALLVLALLGCLYVFLPSSNPWPLFLIAFPAVILVFLSCNMRRNPLKKRRKAKNS